MDAEGRYHGHGTLRLLNGNKYTGEFVHGVFEGHGSYTFHTTNTTYEGQWQNGAKSGRGRETYSDGSVYIGEYAAGEREGKGRMEYGGDRGVFDGGWKDGRKHGEGKVKERVDGKWRWRKGQWVDGRLQRTKGGEGQQGEAEAAEAEDEEEEGSVKVGDDEEQPSVRQRNNVQAQQ